VVLGILFAGTVADLDFLSLFFGPSAYFAWRRTYTHSLIGTIILVIVAVLLARRLAKAQPVAISALIAPLAAAASLHVILDLFQSEGVALLWPFRRTHFAADWLPAVDPWILVMLAAGTLLPELIRLVSSEIGAKDKAPRGRNGAIVALCFVGLYLGARALLHAGSLTALEPHSYQGESPRSIGSFPNALSIFTWRGVVETRSLLCTADVPAGPGKNFDPEAADCLHKPDPSPELDAAQKTAVAQEYLHVTPFPRALVAKTEDGYEVVLRSMRDIAENEIRHRLAARILLDSKLTISDQQLIWASDVRLH
jgi:LexA-binding, inner membrane-associated putative hydrolase